LSEPLNHCSGVFLDIFHHLTFPKKAENSLRFRPPDLSRSVFEKEEIKNIMNSAVSKGEVMLEKIRLQIA